MPDVKRELNIPEPYTSVMPIVIDYPTSAESPPVARMAPEIVSWKKTSFAEPVHAG
jgi:hypothetical protein